MPPRLHQITSLIAHEENINCISIGKKTSQIFVSGGDDGYAYLWSIGSTNPKTVYGPFVDHITALVLNQNEDLLLIGDSSGLTFLFDLDTNKCIMKWNSIKAKITAVSFHVSNPDVIIVGDEIGRLCVLSMKQKKPLQIHNMHNGIITHIAVSFNGQYVASSCEDKRVSILDVTIGKKYAELSFHTDSVLYVEFSPSKSILVSSSSDRSIRFYDLESRTEIPNSIPLDSSPVDIVRFYDNIIITASSDFLKFVSLNPPDLKEHFAIGVNTVADMCVNEFGITIASIMGNQISIYKSKTEYFKPFSQKRPSPEIFLSPQTKVHTPRLLDIAAMKIPNNIPEAPSKKSEKSETDLLSEYRKDRKQFLSQINEKYTRLSKIDEIIEQGGIQKLIQISSNKKGEYGSELFTLIRNRPDIITLESSYLVLQVAYSIISRDKEITVPIIESLIQSYGSLVVDILKSEHPKENNDSRYKASHLFAESIKQLIPSLRTIATGKSHLSQTASEILEEWNHLNK